jgi:hypothetical protein
MTNLRLAASTFVVIVAFVNLWRFNWNNSYLQLRAEDEVVIWEDRLRGVRDTLMKAKYWQGDVGYVRATTLKGHDTTADDDKNWSQVRYVMIPWNVLRHSMEAPYVIADFSGVSGPSDYPASFTKLYESEDGLVVLQRTP